MENPTICTLAHFPKVFFHGFFICFCAFPHPVFRHVGPGDGLEMPQLCAVPSHSPRRWSESRSSAGLGKESAGTTTTADVFLHILMYINMYIYIYVYNAKAMHIIIHHPSCIHRSFIIIPSDPACQSEIYIVYIIIPLANATPIRKYPNLHLKKNKHHWSSWTEFILQEWHIQVRLREP